MTSKLLALAASLMLGACATISSETRTPAYLDGGLYHGERYDIRQRLVDGPRGTYEQTSVVYKGLSSQCIFDSPNDCEAAARQLIDDYNEFIF
ncbi:MAG: hypothetical protein R8G34_07975 [Paracoccaceae bacterium]|nr:hypothetical protein [Paracoccaceae bacterium]